MIGLVSAEATSEYRTRNGKGRPWAIGHLVVRASHRRKGVGGALVRLAAALLLAGNQQCAEVYAIRKCATTTAIATFVRAGFDELVTHADLQKGRGSRPPSGSRGRGGTYGGAEAAGAATIKTKGGVVPGGSALTLKGGPWSRSPALVPGGEPRDGASLLFFLSFYLDRHLTLHCPAKRSRASSRTRAAATALWRSPMSVAPGATLACKVTTDQ